MVTTASARWTDEERFVGIASSGHAIVADSGDHKTANGPMELVLIGLCSCTATDIVNILRKKREPFTSLEVRAEAERASPCPWSIPKSSSYTGSAARFPRRRLRTR